MPPPLSRALGNREYDIGRNGKVVGLIETGINANTPASASQMQIVLNWTEELKRLVPAAMNSTSVRQRMMRSEKDFPFPAGACVRTGAEAARGFVWKRFASGARLIESPHRFVKALQVRVEVRAGLLKGRKACQSARNPE